jgi:TolA-binding protein
MYLRRATCLLFACFILTNPTARAQQPPSGKPAATPPWSSSAPAPSADRIQQMRTDLNQMEGLMNNMQSEINFLRDQNLQILLNTNVRMWTILIRDLRRQLDDEEQRRTTQSSPPQSHSPTPK